MLQNATQSSKEYGDQFVSIELLFVGILKVKDQVSDMLKDQGMNEKRRSRNSIESGEREKSNSRQYFSNGHSLHNVEDVVDGKIADASVLETKN